jgi:Asp-tRNA(Asn)/Glu-tRNA(Gln) amidotransferase A subunit family amidase
LYQEVQSRPLVIGLLVDDGHVKVHPPIERVLLEAAAKLEAAGHIIVPWTSAGHKECVDIMVSPMPSSPPPSTMPPGLTTHKDAYYTSDGGEDIRTSVSLAGEPFLPHISSIINRAPAISVYSYWALNRRKRAAQKSYLAKWDLIRDPTTGRKVDILLTPTMPHSAVPHRTCKWVGYTKVWNLLDYSAVVLPFGRVDKGVDVKKDGEEVKGYEPRNETDGFVWGLYDPEEMHGLPLSVQIVAGRLEEEKVLGAAKVVERVLRG